VLLGGGAALTLGVAGLASVAAMAVTALAARLGFAGLVVEALALTCLLSLRGLAGAAREVAGELGRGDLVAARRAVGYHLVSRPTEELDEGMSPGHHRVRRREPDRQPGGTGAAVSRRAAGAAVIA
jgi:cobalamin biosynthesis protein CobD/CbiB